MIDELLMSFLKDKESALRSLFDDINTTGVAANGLETYLDSIDNCDLEEIDIRKKLKTLMKVCSNQNAIIRKLIFVNLVYMQGGNFDSDNAQALNKMGRGQEALRQMFKNKMGGM